MRLERVFVLGMMAFVPGACHRPSPAAESPAEDRTVFTDSVLHAERCAALAPGEDWRRVCTPKDQAAVLRKAPPAPEPKTKIP